MTENKQPTVSVIVSTFNRQKKLRRAIESILKQTFQDFEIIIVDDASTDKTEKYCRKLEKQHPGRIRYIQRESNWGQHGKVKNEGIAAARANLLAFLDDDNEYLMDHLQALYNDFKRFPEADVVYGDRWVIDESGQKPQIKGICGDFDPMRLMAQNFIDTSDVLVKKQALLDVGGWDEKLDKFADWHLWVRMTKARKKFLHVPKLLTNYYFHAGMNQLKHKKANGEPGGWDPRTGRILPTFNPDDCLIQADQSTLPEAGPLKVAIFTLTYDRLAYTQETFDSLLRNAGYEYDHFVVDNGSTDGTVEWLLENKQKYGIKELILNENNVGISKGSNQALETIGKNYDVVIKIDNDCRIETPDTLKEIVEVFKRTRQLVISPNVEGLIDSAGGVPRLRNGYIGTRLFGFVKHLGGISIAAPMEAYETYRWKEEDFYHGQQDLLFSMHCLKNGFALAYFENLRVMHIDSTEGQKKKFPEYFDRRREEKINRYAEQKS